MTSVVIWRQRDFANFGFADGPKTRWMGSVWMAADSRISSRNNSGTRSTPTDAALKILPVNLKLFREHEDGPGSVPVYEGQIAFAYAGAALPATMTYSMLVSYLRGLTGPYDEPMPSIGQLVRFANQVGTNYAAETMMQFEAFIVAECPLHYQNRKAHAYRLRFDASGYPREAELLDLDPDGSFFLLGSNQDRIAALIHAGFHESLSYNPALAVKEIITEEIAGDIGGYLQLARFDSSVEIYPEWRGDARGLPNPYSDRTIGGLGAWTVNGLSSLI